MVNMNISKKDIPLLLREKCGDDFEKNLHSPILLFNFVPEKRDIMSYNVFSVIPER